MSKEKGREKEATAVIKKTRRRRRPLICNKCSLSHFQHIQFQKNALGKITYKASIGNNK